MLQVNADGSTSTTTDTPYYKGTYDSQVTVHFNISYPHFHHKCLMAAFDGCSRNIAALYEFVQLLAGMSLLQKEGFLQGRKLSATYESSGSWGSSKTTVIPILANPIHYSPN